MAAATLQVLHRNLVPLAVLEPWVGRLANAGSASADTDTFPTSHNVQAFLRALHLQLVLGPQRPAVRSDLLLVLVDMTMLRFRLRRELTRRFPDEPVKGTTYYAVMRALQMKFMRLPKAQVKLGQELPAHYR